MIHTQIATNPQMCPKATKPATSRWRSSSSVGVVLVLCVPGLKSIDHGGTTNQSWNLFYSEYRYKQRDYIGRA